MKRRQFVRYLAIGSACTSGIVGTHSSDTIMLKSLEPKVYSRWVVLYWMPYDNDLMRFGEPIIRMLAEGTRKSDAIVAVQSDYYGDPRMRRRTLINGTIQELDVAGNDSSDSLALTEYLDWAFQTFDAEHWAVIIVGHGGRINEVSPDDRTSSQKFRTWMRVDRFASEVSRLNQLTNGKVELLFFQNCNKATLEVFYEARHCARYTLASQLLLGTPNYYYEGFLERLKEPSVRGREAAIAIMQSERTDMYYTLTLVDNQAVAQIPEWLSPIVERLSYQNFAEFDRSNLPIVDYADEQYCDLLAFLNSFFNDGDREIEGFADFLKTSVIIEYAARDNFLEPHYFSYENLDDFCGIGLYLPQLKEAISRYDSMALYQDIDWVSLYNKIWLS